jgi:hypothetical protein
MIDCRFKPIEKWPKTPTPQESRRHRFRAKWADTLELLEKELSHLAAEDITIEAFFFPQDIRNDGWPRSNARPTRPGVVLKFITDGKEAEFLCDKFADWQQNLRAIALGLEKLRLVDDYGIVAEEGQQYTGWLRLPAAGATDEAAECARILIQHASVGYTTSQILGDQQIFKQVYAEAMRRTHPDTSPGRNVADFQNVVNARDRIKTLKGWQ